MKENIMKNLKCNTCGNSYHWREAFAKFGFDDGDRNLQTPRIVQALDNARYHVKYSRQSPHNTLIYSIEKDSVEFMPIKTNNYRIGYDYPLD
ncbi:MAG: hypothetical protein L3J75_16715 [Methylococcaceae bacterium]|nr:hypothetical protein [Methylococcaceae bacterium]